MANKFNITKITKLFFPWFWQTSENMDLISVLMSSLDQVNSDYGNFEVETAEKIGYSIQKYSLESSLNNQFDNILNRIYIKNGSVVVTNFIYNEAETAPTEAYIYNEAETAPAEAYIYNDSENEGGAASAGFTVYVPSALNAYNANIAAWVERVLILGTTYEIVYYD